MPSPSDAALVTTAHHRQLVTLQELAGFQAGLVWDQFANIDQRSATAFVSSVTPLIAGAVATVGALSAAMFSMLDGLDDLVPEGPPLIAAPVIRGGVPTAAVYERGVIVARRMVGEGKAWTDAMSAGRAQTVSTAQTDVILANRAAANDEGSRRPWVHGYRRVLTSKSCVLCAIASTQRYKRAELMPIHSHCDCDVAPIIGESDPGRVINRQLYKELKRSGASDELSLQQGASRARQRADDNRARAEKWRAELKDEDDPARRERLLERSKNYDDRATKAEELASHRAAQLKEFRSDRGGAMRTVDVQVHGELGPVLTDSAHEFTSL